MIYFVAVMCVVNLLVIGWILDHIQHNQAKLETRLIKVENNTLFLIKEKL